MTKRGRFEGMRDPPRPVSGPPDESVSPPVVLEGHGTIHAGLGTPPPGEPPLTSRPHLWIWIDPDDNAPCREYRWYQFHKPAFYILEEGDINPDGSRSANADPETGLPEITAVTGLKLRFNRWNPDYHKEPIRAEDEQRRADGKRSLPYVRPNWLTPPVGGPKRAKPFIQYGVPGSNPEGTTPLPGLLDGPNFSERQNPDEPSTVEWAYLRKKRPRRHTGDQPPPGTATCEVEVAFRTCLYCIDERPPACLRCLTWIYRERTTLRTEWVRDTSAPSTPTAGISTPPPPRWKLAAKATQTDARIVVVGWGACGS